MDESQLLKERTQKVAQFFTKKYTWITYLLLALVVYISVRIRTRNTPGLRDVTTGGWTLGPDLDPFFFLRWAKEIVTTGGLEAIDMMRYSPLGWPVKRELILHPYLIAWFHKLAAPFGSTSVEQSAALYPVFFFAITVIAFFFLTKKIFANKLGPLQANVIAVIASFFLTVLPSLLPRTIAGIPEKESAAFFFLFISFYFFLHAWNSKHKYWTYAHALFAGIATAAMALIWGGFAYIFFTLALTTLIAFILGQINKRQFYVYTVWLFSSLLIMSQFSLRYSFDQIISSTTTGVGIAIFGLLLIHTLLFNTKLRKHFEKGTLKKLPPQINSLIAVAIIGTILVSIIFGPSFLLNKASEVGQNLIKPVDKRHALTVAENRQPYFGEWGGSFGPVVQGTPVFFWIFFIGSIYLFYHMLSSIRTKDRLSLTGAYAFFMIAIVFSRYRSGHTLNGENFVSIALYSIGVIVLLASAGYYYYTYHRKGQADLFKKIDYNFIFIFAFFFFSIVSARGAVRLIMVLVPSAAIIASYFTVVITSKVIHTKKDGVTRLIAGFVALILIVSMIFAGYQFYRISDQSARGYVPSAYNQQWQQAMSWVRDNTAQDSVFIHWWDYGYWVQTIGERATVLDGGNAIGYWNHLMGRHGLTSPNEQETLDFFYAHNVSHFLIDSTDIGKYTAYSSIGSDVDYDRRSWISTFTRDNSQIFETKNRTLFIYTGGFSLDGDIMYEPEDGTPIFLPGVGNQDIRNAQNVAGLAGIRLEVNQDEELEEVIGIFVYQNNQYEIPLRYAYYNNELIDFGTENRLEAGIYAMPRVNHAQGGLRIEDNGALFYLSERTVQSQLARLYLYGEENEHFSVAHLQDDFVVADLNNQGANLGNFIYFQGFRGPIMIWEVNYPDSIEFDETYIDTHYPQELQAV